MAVIRTLLLIGCAAWSAELRLVAHEEPDYPQLAWTARVQGRVELTYTIGADGVPQAIEVVTGHPLLLPSATANLKSWRFAGDPTAERRRVEFEYVLTGGPEVYKTNDPPTVEFVGAEKVRISVERLDLHSRRGCPAGAVAPPKGPLLRRDGLDFGYGSQRIQVFADGRVLRGKRASKIPKDRAQALIERFRTSQFWTLCQSYGDAEPDGGSSSFSVMIAGYQKQVFDYAEASPAWLRQMIREVRASLMKKR